MQKYKGLTLGSIVREGDETFIDGEWRAVEPRAVGNTIYTHNIGFYRRPVA